MHGHQDWKLIQKHNIRFENILVSWKTQNSLWKPLKFLKLMISDDASFCEITYTFYHKNIMNTFLLQVQGWFRAPPWNWSNIQSHFDINKKV